MKIFSKKKVTIFDAILYNLFGKVPDKEDTDQYREKQRQKIPRISLLSLQITELSRKP